MLRMRSLPGGRDSSEVAAAMDEARRLVGCEGRVWLLEVEGVDAAAEEEEEDDEALVVDSVGTAPVDLVET